MTTANQLNLDSLDRKPYAIGGPSRNSRGRITEPVWQSQRMRRCRRIEAFKGPLARLASQSVNLRGWAFLVASSIGQGSPSQSRG